METTEKKLNDISEEYIRARAGNITEKNITTVVERTEEIEAKSKGLLARFAEDIKLLISIIKDFRNGTYRNIPRYTIGAIAFTLLYVLCPFDIIPDFIPVLGLFDDATMVILCLQMVEKDLLKYKQWKVLQG